VDLPRLRRLLADFHLRHILELVCVRLQTYQCDRVLQVHSGVRHGLTPETGERRCAPNDRWDLSRSDAARGEGAERNDLATPHPSELVKSTKVPTEVRIPGAYKATNGMPTGCQQDAYK